MAASLQAKLTCYKIDCFILRVSELSRLLGEIALRSRSVIWAICTWIPGVVAVIWTDHALLTLESGVSSYHYKAFPATIANQRHSIQKRCSRTLSQLLGVLMVLDKTFPH